ncbi:MAG: response regulator [Acidobacteria bacterium]|nr:response regulator [Acidobacteriota bacterium]
MSRTTAAIRVLLIDDHDAARRGYALFLHGSGYDVLEAATGGDALAIVRNSRPDVIVLDLGLPDIDGWEVARRLKQQPATREIPIIALTGSDLPHERVGSMRAGCDHHLGKPCPPSVLIDTIRACVAPA